MVADEDQDPARLEPCRPGNTGGRKPNNGPFGGEDLLRLQLTCNSLEALVETAATRGKMPDGGGLVRFLESDLPILMRRAERRFTTLLKANESRSAVGLDLLREDHSRIRRLAKAAAKATALLTEESEDRPPAVANPETEIRRYLAAQRHQLVWYRDNLA
jgi:hypothetical protein